MPAAAAAVAVEPVTYTDDELSRFDLATEKMASLNQVTRIDGRLDTKRLEAEFGKPKCEAMFAYLKAVDAGNVVVIPKGFYYDHSFGRELPAPPVVRETKAHYVICPAHFAFAELVDDARHYAHPHGPDQAGGVKTAAKALLKSLLKSGAIDKL